MAVLLLAGAACAPAVSTVPEPVRSQPAVQPTVQPASQPVAALTPTAPADAGMHAGLNALLDSIVTVATAEGAAPGAALAVGRHGRLVHLAGYGRTDTAAAASAVDSATIYDLASLTKVVATTTAAMILEEQGLLDLDRTVASYLPEFNAPDKAGITVRMLFSHQGGLEAFAALYRTVRGREQYLQQINARPIRYEPGTRTIYSDWDMILAQLLIERITGRALDQLLHEQVFRPLGMTRTMFTPDSSLFAAIAPTELDTARGGIVRGAVHDENAWALGGVAGHAGLFSTARDLAVFAQMLLNGGEYAGVRIVQPRTVARWTAPQGRSSSRALGWDTPSSGSSAGRFFSPRSFGHTGFTGTSIWIDPERGLFVILLTNRVYPVRDNNRHIPLRRAVADAAQQAILDAPLINWEERR